MFLTFTFVSNMRLEPVFFSSPMELVVAGFTEVVIGGLIGMASRMAFWAIEFAGFVISQEMGLMMAAGMDPLSGMQSSVVASALYYLGVLILFVTQAHHDLIWGFGETLVYLPAGVGWLEIDSPMALVAETARVFHIGFLMAAPFVAVNILINLVFSVLGRAAPKMNVFLVSFAVRILAGLSLLVTTSVLLAHYIDREIGRMTSVITQFLGG